MPRADLPPFDPTADRHGRSWVPEPGRQLWTLQIRDELALNDVEQLPESRPLTARRDGRDVVGQLVARRRVDGAWWGLCLLDVEWEPGRWQQQLRWLPSKDLTLRDV